VIDTTASRRSTGNSDGSQTKGHFPTEDAAHKLLYLAIQHASPQWTRTRGPTKAPLAFKIQFGDRLPD
jgi:transposase-like protein